MLTCACIKRAIVVKHTRLPQVYNSQDPTRCNSSQAHIRNSLKHKINEVHTVLEIGVVTFTSKTSLRLVPQLHQLGVELPEHHYVFLNFLNNGHGMWYTTLYARSRASTHSTEHVDSRKGG